MRNLTLLLVAVAGCGFAGCGGLLSYKAAPPAPVQRGRVVIDVRDSREPKDGGNKHEEVGVHSGAFGIPDMLTVDGPTVVADTMRRLVADAARAAGIGVTDGPGATARVLVDVQRLWCAGYGGYHAAVTASISVYDPNGQQIRVPGVPVSAEDGGLKCKRVFKHALTDFFRATQAMFANPNVTGALVQ
jgi:hypothetical protein